MPRHRESGLLRTLGLGLSSCARRIVSSLVSWASSAGLFCRLRPRPKKDAMLSGNDGERRSTAEVGDEEEGCSLHAGPDRSYFDGAKMRCMWSE